MYKVTANTADVTKFIGDIPKQIMWALPGAINNSTQKIRDTIYTDYRRFGSAQPSSQNPSRSGLGFTDRTGALRSSIDTGFEINTHEVMGWVDVGMDYSEYVELLWGGKYSFLLPATVQSEDYIQDQVEQAVIRAIERMI